MRGKQHRSDQQTLLMLCSVHEEMIRVFESVCTCICGRWRAKIQKFTRKIARISTEKLRSFGAERARKAQQRLEEAVHMSCRSCDTIL